MSTWYPAVALRAGHRCEYCLAPEVVFNIPFEVEHILPRTFAGPDTMTNLALACRSCNLWKATHMTGIDPETQEEVRLFHPRDDHWEEHFRIDTSNGTIHGCSPIGRATIVCLRMNTPRQQTARQQWMRLGLFP